MTSATPLTAGRSAALLIALLVLTFGVAALGGLATASGIESWYDTLSKPPWNPPRWAFGPVWTVLYTAMAVAGWDVFRRNVSDRMAWLAWGGQLALNALWSPVFFGLQAPGPGLMVITAMWLAIAWCGWVFWGRSRLAALLLVPYLVWVSVAWSLNGWIFLYN